MIAISQRNTDKENCLESTLKSSSSSTNCYYYYNFPPSCKLDSLVTGSQNDSPNGHVFVPDLRHGKEDPRL